MIAALYLAGLFRGPVSVEGTLNELLRWAFYTSFAVMAGTAALGGVRARLILRAGWHAAGQCLAWSGLLAYTGVLDLPHSLLYSTDPAVSVSGVRVGGLLQYPNTYGAVMAAFLLERLFSAARRMRRYWDGEDGHVHEAGRLRNSAHARHAARLQYSARMRLAAGALLPLFPYAAALRLSESRGAWLAAAVAAAAALALQRRLTAPLLLAAAPHAAAAFCCWPAAAGPASLPPLAGAALGWAGSFAAGLWMLRRAQANAAGRAAACAAAAVCWTAAGGAVLALLRARLAAPSSTADARAAIYRDALRLAREQPWLGQGGETWRSLYLAVQSQPYVGSRTHSGYLDILLDVGVAGLAALILLIIAPGLYRLRRHPHLFAAYAALAAHAAVDFDWSYSLVWMLLFWLPALVEPTCRPAVPVPSPGRICTDAPSAQISPSAGRGAAALSVQTLSCNGVYAVAPSTQISSARGGHPPAACDQTPSPRFLRASHTWVPQSAVSALLRLSLIIICLGLAAESFQMLAASKLYQEARRMGQNAFTHYGPVKSELQLPAHGRLAPAPNWPVLA
ncbi:O-antigen ligase family protein, partial [Paenibacillus sp. CN-4]|uniref:O-antigen ligase family protein n=1 Tax=Paenibacillus nanchangensis TaxID=3348343 RepID=UPI0039798A37